MEDKPIYSEPSSEHIRPNCLKPFKIWENPTPHEIRTAMKLAKLTGSELGTLVGVKNSRTVRRWTSGDVPIPYSAWAILCHQANLGIIWDVKK